MQQTVTRATIKTTIILTVKTTAMMTMMTPGASMGLPRGGSLCGHLPSGRAPRRHCQPLSARHPLMAGFIGHVERGGNREGTTTFHDGSVLVTEATTRASMRGSMKRSSGEMLSGTWWIDGEGLCKRARLDAPDQYVHMHRFGAECHRVVTDALGRTWYGCTSGGCPQSDPTSNTPIQSRINDPTGLQRVVYPNGDVWTSRWDVHLRSVVAYEVSPACPDARFAGRVFDRLTWWHEAFYAVGASRDSRSHEWIVCPSRYHLSERALFAAYICSGHGPWSANAVAHFEQRASEWPLGDR